MRAAMAADPPARLRADDLPALPTERERSAAYGTAGEHTRLARELGRLANQQRLIARLARRAVSSDAFLDVLEEALSAITELLGMSHAALLERVPGSELLVMRAGVGWRPEVAGQLLVYRSDDPFVGPALARDEASLVSDIGDRPAVQLLADHGIVSGATVVLPGSHGPIGVLGAYARVPRIFLREELDFLEALAGVLSAAIQRKGTEEGLLQSQLRLQSIQKMEAIGRLAGGIAHDFNNLVQAIGGYTEILLKRLPEQDSLRRPAEEIKKAGDRAAALTRQLLAFSRQQVLQPLVLDLNAVVVHVEQLLRRLIGEDIELEIEVDERLGRVKADAVQLEQVLMNLSVNARDAMPDGGTLTIETRNVRLTGADQREAFAVQPGPYVMLAVADTGSGMDAETRLRAFEPFFTTKPPGHGTGLGLSTVYGIVKQSGGYIWVDSEPGQGTRVRIYLPRVDEPLEQILPKRAPPSVAHHGSETLLLVEDEGGVREVITEWMTGNGYTVLAASNGVEALALAEEYPGSIDLLVADVVMPQMGGPALAARLRPLRPEMKVVFVSGYADEAIGDPRMLELGAAFLQKPFSLDRLLRQVRETLDSPGAQEP
jgi:two-component system, cell cycle sensor histidine kinase and response regulator CckA